MMLFHFNMDVLLYANVSKTVNTYSLLLKIFIMSIINEDEGHQFGEYLIHLVNALVSYRFSILFFV